MITVRVNPESQARLHVTFDNARKGIARGITFGIRAALINVQRYIKQQELSGQMLKNRTGNLRRAIQWRMDSDTTGSVYVDSTAPYARFLNDGSRPHEIRPVNAKALAFTPGAGGIAQSAFARSHGIRKTIAENIVFAMVVHHPGNAPSQFMETGLAATASDTVRIIQNYVNRGLKGEAQEEAAAE